MNELKELPKGWKCTNLKEVSDLIGDGLHGTPKYTADGEYYFINGNNLVDGEIIFKESTKRVNIDEYQKHKKNLNSSTILISINGTLGNTAFYNQEKVILGKSACYVNLSDEADKHYVRYILTSRIFINYALKNASGSTIPNVSLKAMREFKIPLPPLPAQQAIVSKIEELFSELDKGVENLKTAQQQLKVYRQAVLKWAFEGRLTNGINSNFNDLPDEHELGMVAEPGAVYQSAKNLNNDLKNLQDGLDLKSNKTKRLAGNQENHANQSNQGSDNGGLPEGWILTQLKDICLIKRGKSKHRPRNEPSLFGGKYPFIQTGDIRNANGGFLSNYSQTYSKKGLEQSKLWPIGTLCITVAANIGETAILKMNACFPDSVVGLVCNEEKVLNSYTNYFFISHKSKLEALAPATAQKNINVDILEKVKIPLPSIKIQTKVIEEIESRLSVADKMEESIQQSLVQAESLRQSILKKAFEGRLVK
ncbi:type I restriction enzyme S subunit [Pedobacter sp. UYP30]|uniref:restriction endonuclease subunit S n=1 Tax=Pedobacter sp. UYP30 TaxID=1756400 RepID=UPI003395C3AD